MTNRTFKLWSPNRAQPSVQAFMAALSLRKKDHWEWVADKQASDFWVVDCPAGTSVTGLKSTVSLEGTRCQAVFCLTPEVLSGLESNYVVLRTPIQVRRLFEALDRVTDEQHLASQNTVKATQTAPQTEPWMQGRFKLLGWPNITQYDSDIRIIELCTHLFTHESTLSELNTFGIDDDVIQEMLRDAHANGLLHVSQVTEQAASLSTEQTSSQASRAVVRPIKPAKREQKASGIFQKLLKRFAFSD